MKSYTVYIRNAAPPVLVREGFSLGAMVFGPLWLVSKRAWLPALIDSVAWIVILSCHWIGQPVLVWGLLWLQGLFGRDWRRFALQRRGFDEAFVVLGRDEPSALMRLLGEYPGLRSRMRA